MGDNTTTVVWCICFSIGILSLAFKMVWCLFSPNWFWFPFVNIRLSVEWCLICVLLLGLYLISINFWYPFHCVCVCVSFFQNICFKSWYSFSLQLIWSTLLFMFFYQLFEHRPLKGGAHEFWATYKHFNYNYVSMKNDKKNMCWYTMS